MPTLEALCRDKILYSQECGLSAAISFRNRLQGVELFLHKYCYFLAVCANPLPSNEDSIGPSAASDALSRAIRASMEKGSDLITISPHMLTAGEGVQLQLVMIATSPETDGWFRAASKRDGQTWPTAPGWDLPRRHNDMGFNPSDMLYRHIAAA